MVTILEKKISDGMYSTESFPYYQWDKIKDDWDKNTKGGEEFKVSLYYNNGEILLEIFSQKLDVCLSWDCDKEVINWINEALNINLSSDAKIDWEVKGVTCKGKIKIE